MAMDALTQAEVLALIREFNDLLGKMDPQFIKQERDYQSRKRAIVADSHTRLDTLEKTYRRQTDEIKSCSREALKEAENILADVDSMDEQLLAVDKYYKKTKLKKEAELANVQSPKYQKYDDLLSGLEAIRKEYQALSKKYREQMLPFLLNDLHFLFSGQRKHDYEDLIVLQNTVHHFVDSVKDIPLNGTIEYIDTFMLTMAMTALGTDTSIEKFKQAGARPFLLAGLLYIWLVGGGYLLTKYLVPMM